MRLVLSASFSLGWDGDEELDQGTKSEDQGMIGLSALVASIGLHVPDKLFKFVSMRVAQKREGAGREGARAVYALSKMIASLESGGGGGGGLRRLLVWGAIGRLLGHIYDEVSQSQETGGGCCDGDGDYAEEDGLASEDYALVVWSVYTLSKSGNPPPQDVASLLGAYALIPEEGGGGRGSARWGGECWLDARDLGCVCWGLGSIGALEGEGGSRVAAAIGQHAAGIRSLGQR